MKIERKTSHRFDEKEKKNEVAYRAETEKQ